MKTRVIDPPQCSGCRALPAASFRMRSQRWGRLVMIASAAAKYPDAALVDCAAGRAAPVSVCKSLAQRYRHDSVLVNSVHPGLIQTSIWEGATDEIGTLRGRDRNALFEERARQVPLRRCGAPRRGDGSGDDHGLRGSQLPKRRRDRLRWGHGWTRLLSQTRMSA